MLHEVYFLVITQSSWYLLKVYLVLICNKLLLDFGCNLKKHNHKCEIIDMKADDLNTLQHFSQTQKLNSQISMTMMIHCFS